MLRIGRTAAYQLAQRDLATGGAEGLHVVRVGRLLRVPRAALEALAGGPIVLPGPAPVAVLADTAPSPSEAASAPTDADRNEVEPINAPAQHARSTRAEAATTAKPRPDQLTLPFAS